MCSRDRRRHVLHCWSAWLSPLRESRTPPQERKRLHALKRLGIDLTSQETSLDFITKLVTNVCSVNSSMIVLIDSQSCHLKSGAGSGVPAHVRTFSRDISISAWVLAPLNPTVMVVEDLAADPRFALLPCLGCRTSLTRL